MRSSTNPLPLTWSIVPPSSPCSPPAVFPSFLFDARCTADTPHGELVVRPAHQHADKAGPRQTAACSVPGAEPHLTPPGPRPVMAPTFPPTAPRVFAHPMNVGRANLSAGGVLLCGAKFRCSSLRFQANRSLFCLGLHHRIIPQPHDIFLIFLEGNSRKSPLF